MSDINWKLIPSLASLRAFELTARKGSFALAARDLNVTHAAIAQRVRALEEDLGVPLATRSGRTISLTDAGAQLSQRLTEGFGSIADGISELRQERQTAPLQITSTVDFAQSVILPRLHEFWASHPEIQVSVMPTQDIVDIVSLGFDLAIRSTTSDPDWQGLRSEKLAESELIVVGTPSLLGGHETSPSDLPWIWSDGIERDQVAMRSFGLDPAQLRNSDIGVPFLQLSLVRQGLGLTTTTEILVRDDLAAGNLIKAPMHSPVSIKYFVLKPPYANNPKADAFVTWLRSIMAEGEDAPEYP